MARPSPVTFRLNRQQHQALRAVAEASGQTFGEFAREALQTEARRRVESITDPEKVKSLVAALEEEPAS